MVEENPHLLPQNLILGIDPGLDGAIAVYNPTTEQILTTYPMPTVKGPAKANDQRAGRAVDPIGLAILFEKLEKRTMFAVVEEVHSRPQDGVVSSFKFGDGFGCVKGALAGVKIPVHFVKPEVWKILMGVSKDKKTSINKATSLFPDSRQFWAANKLHGHAEAALLAYFGKRFLKSNT